MRHSLTVWLAAVGLAAAGPTGGRAGDGAELVIAGSGTNVLLTEALVKAFMRRHPGRPLKVLPSIGSTGGIKAVHKGKIAMGLASRPLRGLENTWGLTVRPFARTVVVFGANPSVPDDGLSTRDVTDIYSGRRSTWRDGGRIVVLAREEGDSGAEILIRHVEGFKGVLENVWRSGMWRIEFRDGDCNRSLARIKNAMGWTDLGSVRLGAYKIKTLSFNGVAPTADNLLSGKYPLYKELSFVYQEPLADPLVEFVAFVASPEGRELINESGYIPVP
jgi:phosphate transport system substrate-binding protein